jgi:hypothetical protein
MGMAARSIFSRYIQPGAPLEIRVDKLMRTELTNRFGSVVGCKQMQWCTV